MAKIHPSVVAEFRLFGFYLSSGLLAPNTAPEKKLESLFASTELAEMLFGVFANALEVDESGGLINPGAAQLRASDFVSCFGETKGIHGMIFDSHELGLRTSEGSQCLAEDAVSLFCMSGDTGDLCGAKNYTNTSYGSPFSVPWYSEDQDIQFSRLLKKAPLSAFPASFLGRGAVCGHSGPGGITPAPISADS